MKKSIYVDTRLGTVRISEDGAGICELHFLKEEKGRKEPTELLERAKQQLLEYLEGRRKEFDLPLSMNGTEFQLRVWKQLQKIPYGETRSYGQVAAMAGNAKAGRAVGMANNRNPIAILVPCHRVIGADGSLTGYGGGLDIKQALLELEQGKL